MENEISANYIKAVDLDRRIKASAQLAQQSLYDMCVGFKEMRDSKLYKELGYQSFEEYCEKETGFKRRQVYNYIGIVEKLPNDFVHSIAQIGITKMLMLSTLSEDDRQEITENADLENTTVKELENKIKNLNLKLEDVNSENIHIAKQRTDLINKISSLEQQIKELENRPIEVAIAEDSHEVENLKDAMRRMNLEFDEKFTELQEEDAKMLREANQKAELEKQQALSALRAELEDTKAEYEKKLAESSEPDEKYINFKAALRNASDTLKALLKACINFGEYADAEKIAKNFLTDLKNIQEEK